MSESPPRYRARRCTASACGLRFPVTDGSPLGAQCPVCGAPTAWTDDDYVTHVAPPAPTTAARLDVSILLDNIRSVRNVGSIVRTADGAGVQHLYFAGVTPTPDHPKLAKTSLGAEHTVAWSRHPDACTAAAQLVAQEHVLWAIEGGPRSESLFDASVAKAAVEHRSHRRSIVLVFGHEVSGVDPRIIDQCERVLHLPMMGHKGSLNVSVAMGVAVYSLRFGV